MQHIAIETPATARIAIRRDTGLALIVAALLSLCWAVNDWTQIGRLILPDNDDMMRLAQIRDWIAGQGFNDWTQYRLAPPDGAPMHWSRINDIIPAAMILLARPLLGGHGAELFAVIAYPALLFAGYLFLSARIARRIAGDAAGPVALIVAALAYPANSLFLPGRIDHHALQIMLMLGTVLALTHRPSLKTGIVAGIGTALSFGIGLEAAPQSAALMFALFGLWVWRGEEERMRLIGFGAALAGITLVLLAVARPTNWTAAWCDAFTPASTSATLIAGGMWIALGLATPYLNNWRMRLIGGGAIGGACALSIPAAYPVCLTGPYGPMDPVVRSAFMDNVLEARGLFEQNIWDMGLASAGVMTVATIAALWWLWRHPLRRAVALPLAAALLLSDLVLLAQIRGAYLGSALAAPFLATLILGARARTSWRTPAVIGAWLASAGMMWLMVPERIGRAIQPQVRATFLEHRGCNAGPVWADLDRYPAGIVMAPMDRAAYVIGATHHSSVAAGYHRNNAGNRAMYDFFLAPPEQARAVARQWNARYIVLCPTDFSELDIARIYPDSLAAALIAGRTPGWATPLPLRDTGLRFYRIR